MAGTEVRRRALRAVRDPTGVACAVRAEPGGVVTAAQEGAYPTDDWRWFWTAHLSLTRRHRVAAQWSLRRYWTWGAEHDRWSTGVRCPWLSLSWVRLSAAPTLRLAFVQRGVPRWHRPSRSGDEGVAS